MISDMVEFKKKKDWSLMKEAAQGWLARKFLPDQNTFVELLKSLFQQLRFWIRLNEYAYKAGLETHDWDLCLTTGASLIVAYKEVSRKLTKKICILTSYTVQCIPDLDFT